MSTSENDKSEKSDWRILGLAHKFGLAWERAGGTLAELNKLAESPDGLRDVLVVLQGTHMVTPMSARRIRTFTAHSLRSVQLVHQKIGDKFVIASGRDLGLVCDPTVHELVAAAALVGLLPQRQSGKVISTYRLINDLHVVYMSAASRRGHKKYCVENHKHGVSLHTHCFTPDTTYGVDVVWAWFRPPAAAPA